MKAALRNVGLLALSVGLLGMLTGCEVSDCDDQSDDADGTCVEGKSLDKFVADEDDEASVFYNDGQDIKVLSVNGELRVRPGSDETKAVLRYRRFVFRAYDTPIEEVQADLEKLVVEARPTDTGAAGFDVDRLGGPAGLGADLTLLVPPGFNGTLDLTQDNGPTDIGYVGDARGVLLNSENGRCEVAAGGAELIDLYCGNGDLSASVAAVPETFVSGDFETGNGTIVLSFPAAAKFNVQAQAHDGGVVDVTNVHTGCAVNASSESAKTISCNGATSEDPVYTANAHGTSLADVVINVE